MVAYTRVSTASQGLSGLGLAAQRRAIEAVAADRGWSLIWCGDENGERSGDLVRVTRRGVELRTDRRPELDRALALLRKKKAAGLVVAAFDRLARNSLDLGVLVPFFQANNWALVVLDMCVDMTTPEGAFQAGVRAQAADFQRATIRRNTKAALAVKKAQGATLGNPKLLAGRTSGVVLRRIVKARKAGQTLTRIADDLNRDGIPTPFGGVRWWPSSVRAVVLRGA